MPWKTGVLLDNNSMCYDMVHGAIDKTDICRCRQRCSRSMPRRSNAINKPHAAQIAERWIEDQGLAILLNAPQYGGFEIAVDIQVDEIVQTDFSGTGSQVHMKRRHGIQSWESFAQDSRGRSTPVGVGKQRERHVRSTTPVHDSRSSKILQTFRDVRGMQHFRMALAAWLSLMLGSVTRAGRTCVKTCR
jgi:hypothetical protein